MKKIITSIDGFGTSKEVNGAILKGYHNGYLKSVAIIANGEAFLPAVNDILPECTNLDIGIQLNITSNKSLTNGNLLVNAEGYFNGGLLYFYINSGNKNFMMQLEKEFRAQIEQVLLYSKISFITSKSFIHLIPNIFRLCIDLAEEYRIPFIRTYDEKLFFVSNYTKYFNLKFPLNLIKTVFTNIISKPDKNYLLNTKIKTNDSSIGLLYSDMSTIETTEHGLKLIVDENNITELVISTDNISRETTSDFSIILNKKLEDTIKRIGFDITSYKELNYE